MRFYSGLLPLLFIIAFTTIVSLAQDTDPLVPPDGYYQAEITANVGGTNNAGGGCFSPVAEGYRAITQLTFSSDGREVKMTQEAPLEDMVLLQVEPGVYEYSRASGSSNTAVDRLTVVPDGEILREDFVVNSSGGCQLSNTWTLTYAGEENPQETGPLKIGAWAIVVDSIEGSDCSNSSAFSNMRAGALQYILQVTLSGNLIFDDFYMASSDEESVYINQGGLNVAQVNIEDPETSFKANLNMGLTGNCRANLTGTYIAESVLDRLLALEPSDPAIIPANGQWINEVITVEVPENTLSVCQAQQVGSTYSQNLEVSEDGNTLYSVFGDSRLLFGTRGTNGNFYRLQPSAILAFRVISPSEMYQINQWMACGIVTEIKITHTP